jgi:putrescine importer
MQPIAPVGIFGISQKMSHGHVVTTVLIAMVAMMLTGFSFGRLASLYPSAGSAYTYVSRELNPHLGFLTGWAMSMDYLMFPLINTVFGSLTLYHLFPQIPYVVWVALFVIVITYLNLRGIKSVAHVDTVFLGIMTAVIVIFVVEAIHYLAHTQGWGGVFSFKPFYDPRTFDFRSVSSATSLAALTYVGFDAVTTLAEEVHDPKRTLPLAIMLVPLLTGVYSTLEVYLGALVWPNYLTFPNPEMGFLDVTRRVGGPLLLEAMGVVFIIACVGSGLAGQVGLARLLYSMGRDNVLPRRLFAHLDAKRSNPTYNIGIIAVLTFVGALLISYQRTAELLNFGAFLGYMGVNVSAIHRAYVQWEGGSKFAEFTGFLVPGLGFLFCLGMWLSLPTPAKMIGGTWFGLGIIYDAIKTRGFRTQPKEVGFLGT